jgi:hypothetical protein
MDLFNPVRQVVKQDLNDRVSKLIETVAKAKAVAAEKEEKADQTKKIHYLATYSAKALYFPTSYLSAA